MIHRTMWQTLLLYALATITAFALLLPVAYIFFASLFVTRSGSVGGFSLDNFTQAIASMPLVRQIGNSLLVTLCQTAGQIVTAVLAAYALVFCRLKHANAIMMLFLLSMMIPGETTMLSNYLTVSDWHLIDTLPAVFLPFLVQGFNIFLFRQSFATFPSEIREAAMLDGAGHMRFMRSILLPMSRPTLIAATVNSAIAAWNGYFWPLLVTNSPEQRTIQVGITQLAGAETSRIGVVMAGTALAILPPLALMIWGNTYLRGLSVTGALK